MSSSNLFQPTRVGTCQPKHRIVLAPAMRLRADADRLPSNIMLQYYEQRSRVPGTLLIAEATVIAPKAGGYSEFTAGIWNEKQIAAWKNVRFSLFPVVEQ
jgi:NADPH2 dehydrogenase